MNSRIKKIRKEAHLSQEEFGARLHITRSSVCLLESGRNNPSDQTLALILSEFHINRHWLETGEGDMYDAGSDSSAESLVPDLVDILNSNPALLRVVRSAARHMTAQDWERLNVFIELCAEDFIAAKAAEADPAQESTEE